MRTERLCLVDLVVRVRCLARPLLCHIQAGYCSQYIVPCAQCQCVGEGRRPEVIAGLSACGPRGIEGARAGPARPLLPSSPARINARGAGPRKTIETTPVAIQVCGGPGPARPWPPCHGRHCLAGGPRDPGRAGPGGVTCRGVSQQPRGPESESSEESLFPIVNDSSLQGGSRETLEQQATRRNGLISRRSGRCRSPSE